jgi:hypothetical protein
MLSAAVAAGAALGVVLLAQGAATGQAPTAPAGLDHFKCYSGSQVRFKQRTVKFKDQFGEGATRVVRQGTLCNPVSKNGGRVLHRSAHLNCYLTKDVDVKFTSVKADITNQFGTTTVEIVRPEGLCVPSLKSKTRVAPPTTPNPEKAIDHFRCYVVTPVDVSKSVKLTDQFGSTATRTLRLVELCTPVSKNGGRVRRPKAHLACYSIKDGSAFKPRTVRVRNQFGLVNVRAIEPSTLCLPSFKKVLG